jgi:hypothetical protein
VNSVRQISWRALWSALETVRLKFPSVVLFVIVKHVGSWNGCVVTTKWLEKGAQSLKMVERTDIHKDNRKGDPAHQERMWRSRVRRNRFWKAEKWLMKVCPKHWSCRSEVPVNVGAGCLPQYSFKTDTKM